MDWRVITDKLKHLPWVLNVADKLGRNHSRLRPLSGFIPPPRLPPRIPPRIPPRRCPEATADLAEFTGAQTAVLHVGHATLLIKIGSTVFLTDPVFSSRVGPSWGPVIFGPKRYVAPAVPFSAIASGADGGMPGVSAILLSHAHFDHLDLHTLSRLPRGISIVCPTGLDDLIEPLGFERVMQVRAGEAVMVGDVRITAVPVNHWGARVFVDSHRGYTGYLLESVVDEPRRRILFCGDTADTDLTISGGNELTERQLDLVCMGIGAYEPYVQAHATPEQAWEMAKRLGAKFFLPMHHSVFRLSEEPMREPMERLRRVSGEGGNGGGGKEGGGKEGGGPVIVASEPGDVFTMNR